MKKATWVVVFAHLLLISSCSTVIEEPVRTELAVSHGRVPFLTLAAEQLLQARSTIHPFLNSSLPRPNDYSGAFFELNHDYPKELPPSPEEYRWKKVTGNGLITQKNAYDYVMSLKEYVSDDMRRLIFDRSSPNNDDWYQSIWLGSEREPIHGAYVGSGFPAETLAAQTLPITTYVYTLYDKRAAKTLGDIWGRDFEEAMDPVFSKETTQFAEGSVITKLAFVTSCGLDWEPMQYAAVWQIYAPVNANNGSAQSPDSKCADNGSNGDINTPTITNVYLMQFDIIVKDSVAAPDTGWVFSTLVYDKDAQGEDAWDKMVPLGATWGGNPDVINLSEKALTPPVRVNQNLNENWINLDTPLYARSTLGWDGRLSGPNDGAVVTPAWAGGQYYHKGIASVGCLGCHSSAQYPMTSFLLPTTNNPGKAVAPPLSSQSNPDALVLAEPGSSLWMKWFQSNSGTTPLGPATSGGKPPIALDYDMVTAFKAIPQWQTAVKLQ